ncbi:MAG: 4Fe-4S binding protein [Burkholderiales bacterium]|nr:4Fe-4S binding protein [Burkholderiales bacterium]
MALKILDTCIACAACLEPCPNGAITEGLIFVIDAERCAECVGDADAPQCVPQCPVDAIVPDEARRENAAELLDRRQRNRALEGSGKP